MKIRQLAKAAGVVSGHFSVPGAPSSSAAGSSTNGSNAASPSHSHPPTPRKARGSARATPAKVEPSPATPSTGSKRKREGSIANKGKGAKVESDENDDDNEDNDGEGPKVSKLDLTRGGRRPRSDVISSANSGSSVGLGAASVIEATDEINENGKVHGPARSGTETRTSMLETSPKKMKTMAQSKVEATEMAPSANAQGGDGFETLKSDD